MEGVRLLCALCDKHYKWQSHLNEHMWEKHGVCFACPECGSQFGKKQELYLHMNDVHETNMETCRMCEKIFKTFGLYKAHMKNIHNTLIQQKQINVKKCGFMTSSKYDLQNHILKDHISTMECNSGLAICKDCDYVTKRKDTLREHVQTKHQQNLFRCDECNFETFNPRFFRKHKSKGHDKMILKRKFKYVCFQCEFVVARPTLLRTHMLGSHNEEKYRCSLCDYKCEFIADLSNHMILRHKKSRHVCKKCKKVYESVEDLRKHQKSVHKQNAPDLCDGCKFVEFQFQCLGCGRGFCCNCIVDNFCAKCYTLRNEQA